LEYFVRGESKYEFFIQSTSQLEKIAEFLIESVSSSNQEVVFLKKKENPRPQADSNHHTHPHSLISTISPLRNQFSKSEWNTLATFAEEENPALNTIVNFYNVNKDKNELLQNLKMFLIDHEQGEGFNGYGGCRPTSGLETAENNQRRKKESVKPNMRPTTSKGLLTQKRFETDSEEEKDTVKKDQNRFFAIMDEIENRSLIDQGEKIGVLKTLILEENQVVFQIMEN